MKNIIIKGYKIGIILMLIIGCTVKDNEQTVSVEILSDLPNVIKIDFYDRGFQSNTRMQQINGQGLLFTGSFSGRVVGLSDILASDSIRLSFDNQSVEIHLLEGVSPTNTSLFNKNSYQDVDGILRYTISESNINNSINCMDDCN
jgi:hypothetical protein